MNAVTAGPGTDRAASALPGPPGTARRGAWRALLGLLVVTAAGDVGAVLTVGSASAHARTAGVPGGAVAGAGAGGAHARTEVSGPDARTLAAGAPAGPAGGSAQPVSLEIRSIGVRTPLVGVTLGSNRELAAPDPGTAGWWSQGTVPGETGPAVVVGHVDSRTGPAVFFRLRELRPDDLIRVSRTDGKVVTFTVQSVQQYPKRDLPTATVYGPTRTPSLRLVTCGGRFDKRQHSYDDNVVVFAGVPAPGPARGRA